ncbi:MAG: hypothetical protein M0Q49_03240 [Porticoccaceae bacterium]|nr:hypothetical protein [Porticoccaceae bacterium]
MIVTFQHTHDDWYSVMVSGVMLTEIRSDSTPTYDVLKQQHLQPALAAEVKRRYNDWAMLREARALVGAPPKEIEATLLAEINELLGYMR